jgi:hypothetical protein
MAMNMERQESRRVSRGSCLGWVLLLLALGAAACRDSGHRPGSTLDGATPDIGASGGTGGGDTGGGPRTGGASGGGGNAPATGGSPGSGGGAARGGGGGTPGTGGSAGTGSGTGGRGGSGGVPGSGGTGSGSGGRAGTGGASGTGGAAMPDGGAGGGAGAGATCSGKVAMECAEGLVCDLDVSGRCLASTAGGHCAVVPVSCDNTTGPSVCGCDGRTYATDCDRRRARTALDHTGACAAPDGGAQPVTCGAVTCGPSEVCVHRCTCAIPGCQNPPPTCAGSLPASCASPSIADGHAYCLCPP